MTSSRPQGALYTESKPLPSNMDSEKLSELNGIDHELEETNDAPEIPEKPVFVVEMQSEPNVEERKGIAMPYYQRSHLETITLLQRQQCIPLLFVIVLSLPSE